MNKVNFFALGGLDENGKNSYVLDINGKLFIINCGTKIPINTHNGVDTLICDYEYLERRKKDIVGLFITDVKDSSFSAIPWLIMKLPGLKIYTSVFNRIVIMNRITKYNVGTNNFEIKTFNSPLKFKDVIVSNFDVAGGLPGQMGLNFEYQEGNILFLVNFVIGDLGSYGKTDLYRIKKLISNNKPLQMLIMDVSRANYSGKSIDKIWVTKKIESKFSDTANDKRIVFGLYDEDMIIAHEILLLAHKYKRPVMIYGKNYSQLIDLVSKISPNSQFPEFVDIRAINETPNAVVLVTSSTERLYSRLLRVATNNDVYLKLKKDDTVIIIAPPINGLEVSYALTLDEIARRASNLIELSSDQLYPCNPARDDIYNVIKELRPKYFIPIQGLYRYLVLATKIARSAGMNISRCIVLQNGRIAEFVNNELVSQKQGIKSVGDVVIDGFGIGDISQEVINERENLSRDGVIALSCLINYKTRKPIGKLHISSYGIVSKENKDTIIKIINNLFLKEFENKSSHQIDLKDIQEHLRKTVKRKIFKSLNKEPIIVVTLYEI
ncbi:ribonuclease J [Metamycoplasma auris]|uniref:Ribonuclease J n=1 Tax=Metamycoplasma auris TaxID=51363 RepID=A0A2W7I267_9BACT|nr:ribonuclease J [Metamycoplasma auris]PZW01526.1 ribonuclease J [Metamycoplasma auris]